MDHESDYQGRSPESIARMHRCGGISGILFFVVTAVTAIIAGILHIFG